MFAVAGIGGRAGRPGRGGYQSGGVLRPAVPVRPGQHRLVTVQLHVPGQENRQHPGQGVVPVQTDHQQGEAPFQVVPPGQVDGLVEEHQGKGLLRHAGGQENGGAEQAAGHGGGQSGVLQHPEPTAGAAGQPRLHRRAAAGAGPAEPEPPGEPQARKQGGQHQGPRGPHQHRPGDSEPARGRREGLRVGRRRPGQGRRQGHAGQGPGQKDADIHRGGAGHGDGQEKPQSGQQP